MMKYDLRHPGDRNIAESCRVAGGKQFTAHCPNFIDPLAGKPDFPQPGVIYAIDGFHQLFATGARWVFVEEIDLAGFITEIVQYDPRFLIPKSVAPDGFEGFHCRRYDVAGVLCSTLLLLA